MGNGDGYEYDVFISYPHGEHDRDIATWVQQTFYEYFETCLTNSPLGRTVYIHLDTNVIKPGDKWETRLKDALARSRILVPIFSINYFRSTYCRAEFAVMLHRERQLGYWNGETEGSLIVPVHLWGEPTTFPEVARKFHWLKCSDYTGIPEDSERYAEFKKEVKDWMPDLSKRIKSVPSWNAVWCDTEWIDDPINKSERSRELWPPNEFSHFQSMGWIDEED